MRGHVYLYDHERVRTLPDIYVVVSLPPCLVCVSAWVTALCLSPLSGGSPVGLASPQRIVGTALLVCMLH